MKLLNILQEYSIPRSLEGFNLNMFQWESEWRSTVLSPNQMFKGCLMMFETSTVLGEEVGAYTSIVEESAFNFI